MKGPRQALPLSWTWRKRLPGHWEGGLTMNLPSLGFQRDTEVKEQERRHSLNSALYFSPLYWKVSMESRDIRDTAILSCWTERQKCQFHPLPHPNQLLKVFAAGNWPQVSLQTLQTLAILAWIKGSAWKNNRLPSWKGLEELPKRKWNPNIISCSYCRNKRCSQLDASS